MSGKKATSNIIPGKLVLSVGKPDIKIPKNWAWIKLEDIATLATGHTPSRKFPEYWGGNIPWMAVGDARKYDGKKIHSTKENTNELGIKNSAAVLLPEDTVCLSRTASIGYSIILGRPMATSQGFVNWICSELLIPRYLQCIFLFEKQFLYSISEGTAHTTIYFPEVKAFHIALPPIREQRRIVNKLDKMFAQLEIIKAEMDKIPKLLKDFRRQILTQAVTGKLTAEWRKGKELENDFIDRMVNNDKRKSNINLPNGWLDLSFDSVVNIKSNLVNPNDYLDYPLITPDVIQSETGVLLSKPLVSDIMPISAKHYFSDGNIIYSKIRPYLSKLIIADFDGLCSADMYPISTDFDVKYLFYFMLSNEFLVFATTAGERSVLPKINQKGLNIIPIPTPSLKEQKEIVSRVESLFVKADAVEKQYELLKIKINNLPQALLHKTFKGELTEQLDSDGDARELLAQIKKLKPNITAKKLSKKDSKVVTS